MENISIYFGQRIRGLRQAKNISQEKLAELSGLHTTYIGQLERGEKSPTLDSIYKIAFGLNIGLDRLFENMECNLKTDSIDYASKTYNRIIGLDNTQKEKIYQIVCSILDL